MVEDEVTPIDEDDEESIIKVCQNALCPTLH